MRRIAALVCILLIGLPVVARGRSGGHSRSGSRSHSSRSYRSPSHTRSYASRSHSKPQHVRSYTTNKGTVVHSYNRASAGTAPKRSTAPRAHYASPKTYSTHSTMPHRSTIRTTAKHEKRSEEAKNSFKHSHPCPSTGKSSGACPGYVVDHVKPLACGGADAPSNMQWQTVAAGKAKDKVERKGCR